MNYIVFDTETTGLDPEVDELLQVSIIDGTGKVLFNEYIKPTHHRRWDKAMAINGITPELVSDSKTIDQYRSRIQKCFDECDGYVTYNGQFDIKFLTANGIHIVRKPHLDAMKIFAIFWGEKRKNTDMFTWQKLTTAARYFKVKEYDAHDSVEDCRATLEVAKKLCGKDLRDTRIYDNGKVPMDIRLREVLTGRAFTKNAIRNTVKHHGE